MKGRSAALIVLAASFWSTASCAAVFTYTDEAAYLTALSAASSAQWSENFESGAWNGLRTTIDMFGHRTYHTATTATNQGVTWTPPSYQSYLTTEQRNHALPGESNATYIANAWSLTAVTRRNGDLDAFAGSSVTTLYGAGGWFDSLSGYKVEYNDDGSRTYLGPEGHMWVSLDGGVYNNFGAGGDADPDHLINGIGQFCPDCSNVPRFFGIINTAGFHTFNFATDVGYPQVGDTYYGPMVYADNFTFGGTAPRVAEIPEPSTLAVMGVGLLCLGWGRKRRGAPTA